MDSYKI